MPVQEGLLAHFRAVGDAVGIPIILHDVPSRAAPGLADIIVARLAENPRFIGLMDPAGDPTRPGRLRTLLGEGFRLLSGDDRTTPGIHLPLAATAAFQSTSTSHRASAPPCTWRCVAATSCLLCALRRRR